MGGDACAFGDRPTADPWNPWARGKGRRGKGRRGKRRERRGEKEGRGKEGEERSRRKRRGNTAPQLKYIYYLRCETIPVFKGNLL
jgi:hypothetical protein